MTPSDEQIIDEARKHATAHVRDSVLTAFARAVIALDRARATAEPVAWQWRKKVGWGGYYDWCEWEAVQPPYMDAHKFAKSDPENYEVRPLYLRDKL